MRKISESTVRRLSLYLGFLEQFATQGQTTISSAELARRGGTTSAQVRKDLSFFGSFGKRGLGYSVPELTARIRDILGLRRTYRVVLVGAGRIGSALVQYPGFRQRGFHVTAIYDKDPKKHKDARMFRRLSYLDVLNRGLEVMDSTAISLCRDNNLPILVFNMTRPGNIRRVVLGEPLGTLVLEERRTPRSSYAAPDAPEG